MKKNKQKRNRFIHKGESSLLDCLISSKEKKKLTSLSHVLEANNLKIVTMPYGVEIRSTIPKKVRDKK
jgi:hypothetical protein